jgi:hypothetical protein
MIINLGDGVIAAMPEDPVECCYSQNYRTVVFKQPASPPLAHQSPVAVLSLRRQAERFYALQMASGRSCGPHIFLRQK